MNNGLIAVIVGLIVSVSVRADDWPQFRGPDRTGVSKEKGLLTVWPKEGPKLLWTFKDAGLGFSTVSISKGVVYTLGTDKDNKNDIIIAIDEKTGTQKWTAVLGPLFTFKGNVWGDGPRCTPTVDGNFLYALGGFGDLVCVDVSANGKEVWRKNLEKDFGGVMMTEWGYSESPLVDGDLLICTPGGKNGTLAALNKKTGALVWQTKDWTQKAPYSSAVVAEIQGVRQYIQAGYTGGPKGGNVSGVDAKTGKVLWSKQFFTGDSYNVAPSPIVSGNLVFATAGGGGTGGCQLLDINAKQDATEKFTMLKLKKRLKNNHGGLVLIGDHVYGHTDPGAWICMELKSGADVWSERDTLKCTSGAVTAAEGKLYLYTDEGEVGLIDASPKGFNLISSFKNPQTSKLRGPGARTTGGQALVWAHPVIANGVLYLRDSEFIFAFKIAK
jgi:outer membrane protein assembly factor BamB